MIRLYKCYACWYVFDDVLVRSGKHTICPCGVPEFRPAQPTFLNILFYIIFQKKHAIKRILERERA